MTGLAMLSIIDNLSEYNSNQIIQSVKSDSTTYYRIYSKLKHANELNYFCDSMSTNIIGIILKSRTNTLNLNGSILTPSNSNRLCSLCNLQNREDAQHFIAICPVLKEIRRIHFGNVELSEEEYIAVLNGQNFINLYNYVCCAIKYRLFLIEHFNT